MEAESKQNYISSTKSTTIVTNATQLVSLLFYNHQKVVRQIRH